MSWPVHVIRLVLGATMLYAGAVKALDPGAFAASLERYHLFPAFLLAPLAAGLPWLEIVSGGALALNRLTAGASALCTALGVGFVVALGSAWWRGLDIDCGCFGGDAAGSGNLALALGRAAGILGLAVALLFITGRKEPSRELTPNRIRPDSDPA